MDVKEVLKEFMINELVSSPELLYLDDSQSLLEEGIIDSVAVMKLLTFIEETYSIKIGDEELIPENFETLNTIENLITKKTNCGEVN